MSTVAEVRLWGRTVGAVLLDEGARAARFEYAPDFLASRVELAPLTMPLGPGVFSFPGLRRESFRGLPGLLSDSLPDRYGRAVIDAWLATQGRAPDSLNPVERLCYTGDRGMGALEFRPALGPPGRGATPIQVAALVELASEVLGTRRGLRASLDGEARSSAMEDILRVGTSAGGARAKAVIAWNPVSGEVRSGQVPCEAGFEHWLLKLDGVSGSGDRGREDPTGYGAVEFAYSRMAAAAGVEMTACRLLEEGGRRHFMTRRFDRTAGGGKLHMQSLAALAHLDFNAAGAHSYEEAFLVLRRLGLGKAATEQLFRRMAFNVVARNQDDHVKNIAFLMDRRGTWSLAPAYDVTWAYNPSGAWTAQHQMSINGKRDDLSMEDLRGCARAVSMKRGRAQKIVGEVVAAVRQWPRYAGEAGVGDSWREQIQTTLRLDI